MPAMPYSGPIVTKAWSGSEMSAGSGGSSPQVTRYSPSRYFSAPSSVRMASSLPAVRATDNRLRNIPVGA